MEDWDPRRVRGLLKPLSCHIVNVFSLIEFRDDITDSMKSFFSHGLFKRFIVVLVVELDLCLLYFVIFIKDDSCGALRFKAGLEERGYPKHHSYRENSI